MGVRCVLVDLGVIVGCWGSDVEGDLVSHLVFLVALGVVEDGRFGGGEDMEGVGGDEDRLYANLCGGGDIGVFEEKLVGWEKLWWVCLGAVIVVCGMLWWNLGWMKGWM